MKKKSTKKNIYNSIQIASQKEEAYLIKCYLALFKIVREKSFQRDSTIIEQISEAVIIYFFIDSKNNTLLNNGCDTLNHEVNFMFMNRLRNLIRWRIIDFKKCKNFVFHSSISLIEEVLGEDEEEMPGYLEYLYQKMNISDLTLIIEKAVEQLPDKQRSTIKCFYYQDFNLRETAEIHNVSYQTAKSNKKDGVQNLKKKLYNIMGRK